MDLMIIFLTYFVYNLFSSRPMSILLISLVPAPIS